MNVMINPILSSLGPVLLVLGYSLFHIRHQKKRNTLSCQAGLRNITYLRKLLEAVPQHRGMVNAQLQGDDSFSSKIVTVQHCVNKNLSLLQNEKRILATWDVDHLLQKIDDNWQQISKNYTRYNAVLSFSKHTTLVTDILYLLSETAAESGILADHKQYYQMAVVANQDLPLVTELLGQARGLGTGIAAKGNKTSTDRVKLLYRLNKLNSVVIPMTDRLRKTLAMSGLTNSKAMTLLSICQEKTAEFIALLDNNIVNSEYIEIKADTYYSAGTEAINSNFLLLDSVNELIQIQINQE